MSFDVEIKNDDMFEGNESFNLTIMSESLPNYVTADNINRSSVMIKNDDCKFNCCLIIDKFLTKW